MTRSLGILNMELNYAPFTLYSVPFAHLLQEIQQAVAPAGAPRQGVDAESSQLRARDALPRASDVLHHREAQHLKRHRGGQL